MNTGRQKEIEEVIEAAWGQGRRQLFEHEVYSILEILYIRTPVYRKIDSEEEITRELLSSFGSSRVVMKIISSEVAHKEKLGGVKVLHKDLDFICYSYRKMTDIFTGQGLKVEGVLLVDFVEYSPALGNEILIGFQESEVFGPVLSFSKGGSDAELFAERFSPPNLLLPPVTADWARALLASTEIHNKYIQEGKADYIDRILELKLKMSELSIAFSNFFTSTSSFALKEFEINPFVFDPDGRLIALDGYAVFDRKKGSSPKPQRPPVETLKPFFHPDGIAVVGVSASSTDSAGNIITGNLLRLGREDVFCVNPKGGEVDIEGRMIPLYSQLGSLPKEAELVIITVPAEATLEVVRQAAGAGCRAVLLIPGGFNETGKNEGLEDKIAAIALEAGMRVMGPNCLGIVYAGGRGEAGLNTFFIPEKKFKIDFSREQNIALFSQSGALGLVELSNLKKSVSPKVAVSYGNQLDVDPGDLVEYFQDEDGIKAIGIYIEGFKPGAGRRFFEITSRSRIPIVVYKAGRTKAGRMATQSHTASMAGEYAVAKAALKQAGLVVADTMADHLGCLKIFAMLHEKKVHGRRIAVVTNAGYEKANAADNLKNLELAELSPETSRLLESILPSFVTVEPLLDLTPMVDDAVFVRSVEILLGAPEVDAVCVSIVPQAGLIHTTDDEVDNYSANIGRSLADAAASSYKPMVISLTVAGGGDEVFGRLIEVMESGGLPTYFSAEQAMSYLNEFIRYRLIREQNLLGERMK
ncbi:MAG: acetate--CoA ligase family protein [Spirochaetales bacterium]|nr:acetate--CoA ligase family protein [Spirochaetales bacterium]